MEDNSLFSLQKVEFEMLKDVASFCDNNHIKYFIIAGTLLGAIRHRGFIPWDDDIDIGMDYKNYKKFLKLAKEKLPKKYFVQHFSTDRKVGFPWIKVRMNNTTCMDPNCINYDIHSGVGMDIFLLCGISKNKIKRYIQTKANLFQRVLLLKYVYKECKNVNKTHNRELAHKLIPEFLRILLISILDRAIGTGLEKAQLCFNTYYMHINTCYKFNSRWFLDLERIKFENEYFWAPKESIKYLETRYGDWQSLPPEGERNGHGDIIIDLYHDYSMYYGQELKKNRGIKK